MSYRIGRPEAANPPANPPAEPPATVASEIMWRLAVRLFRDHSASPDQVALPDQVTLPDHVVSSNHRASADVLASHHASPAVARCHRCGQPWPCSGRRLAELGLSAAQPCG